MPIEVSHHDCDLCGECVGVCLEKAIYIGVVPRRIEIKEEKCNECEACVLYCPALTITEEVK